MAENDWGPRWFDWLMFISINGFWLSIIVSGRHALYRRVATYLIMHMLLSKNADEANLPTWKLLEVSLPSLFSWVTLTEPDITIALKLYVYIRKAIHMMSRIVRAISGRQAVAIA